MITIEEAYEAIKGRKEFVVTQEQYTISFDYIVIMNDSFTDEKYGWIRRNFRGITFCKNSGKLVSLPFHKFYNVGQNEESQFNLHKHKKASIYEKLDGSMIHFYKNCNDDLVASTCRSSKNVQSRDALEFVNKNPELSRMIRNSIDNNFTPIFEWVAPHNQIVCYYAKPRLVYLNSRNRDNGNYIFEETYNDKAKKYNIDFKNILNNVDGIGIEGYVCHLECGTILKVKTPWYLERHRSVDLLTRPKYKVYELALGNAIDDIINLAADAYKDTLKQIQNEVAEDFIAMKYGIQEEYKQIINAIGLENPDIRKIFALKTKNHKYFPAFMALISGKEPDSFIKKWLLEDYTKKYPERIMRSDI